MSKDESRACALMTWKLLEHNSLSGVVGGHSNDWNTYQQACQALTLQDWNNACFDHIGDHPDGQSRVRGEL